MDTTRSNGQHPQGAHKRAVIYTRVSSERQAAEDRVSIDAQEADCRAYCEQHGYSVTAVYVDKDKYRSRKKLVQPSGQRKDRPQYQAMLKAARAGEFDVIIAWKEDRLYRGMYAAMPFSEMLDEMGKRIGVELVKETFDRKMLGIKAALGKIESDNIRERMIMGRKARLERGEVPGGDQVIYGYQRDNKRLVINKDEALWVRKIYGWYLSHESNAQMRRRLNTSDAPTRKGGRWSESTIENILTCEAYAVGFVTVALDGETFKIPCEPIISLETWQRARDLRKANIRMPKYLKEDYLCAGLVYCACGWKLQVRSCSVNQYKNPKYTKVYGYYCCQRIDRDPESRPPDCASSTGNKKVDDYTWSFVKKICEHPDILRAALERKIAMMQAEQGDIEAEQAKMQNDLDSLIIERQWVITQARKGAITENDMQHQLAALQFQEWELRKKIDELSKMTAARQHAETMAAWAQRYLSDIAAGVKVLDADLLTLTAQQRANLAAELQADRFEDKFPGDELAQLQWAVFEEKRRTVRTLISRIIVGKTPDGKRKITPILALDMPLESSLDFAVLISGDQSLDAIETRPDAKFVFAPVEQ